LFNGVIINFRHDDPRGIGRFLDPSYHVSMVHFGTMAGGRTNVDIRRQHVAIRPPVKHCQFQRCEHGQEQDQGGRRTFPMDVVIHVLSPPFWSSYSGGCSILATAAAAAAAAATESSVRLLHCDPSCRCSWQNDDSIEKRLFGLPGIPRIPFSMCALPETETIDVMDSSTGTALLGNDWN
jgi:hypothetical protein